MPGRCDSESLKEATNLNAIGHSNLSNENTRQHDYQKVKGCFHTADIARNFEFLYDKNRLNVAVSRAQALAVVVASPQLLSVECKTIDQVKLANMLCRYAEMADLVTL